MEKTSNILYVYENLVRTTSCKGQKHLSIRQLADRGVFKFVNCQVQTIRHLADVWMLTERSALAFKSEKGKTTTHAFRVGKALGTPLAAVAGSFHNSACLPIYPPGGGQTSTVHNKKLPMFYAEYFQRVAVTFH